MKKLASEKKLDWLPSRNALVERLNEDLNDEKISLNDAMVKIETEFHRDIVSGKIHEDDLRKVENQIGINVRKG